MKRNIHKNIIGFTCGAMDLLHAGHVLMLKECKSKCDFLIVGLQTDPSIDRKNKHKPIESIKERMIRLEGCKYVDKIIIYKTESDLFNLLKKIKPDIRFLGKDHKGKAFTGDHLPIKIIFNSRNHKYSSSNLIERMINSIKK